MNKIEVGATVLSQLNSVQKETDVELKVANALWAQKGYQFRDEFIRVVRWVSPEREGRNRSGSRRRC